jgi:hypothetical protein
MYLFSGGRCITCYRAWKKFTIKSKSQRGKERHKKYSELRVDYLKDHPVCEICDAESQEIHHKSGRIGENLFKDYMNVCRDCHNYIHSHVEESYGKGWMLKRNIKQN